MIYEVRMNEDSLYCLYKNQIPIAIFNASMEHTAAREIENILNGKILRNEFLQLHQIAESMVNDSKRLLKLIPDAKTG